MKEKGQTLIEVVIALAVLGLITTSVFQALNISLTATGIVNQRTTAESLTRSELEYIKNHAYVYWQYDPDAGSTPPDYGIDPGLTIPPGCSISPIAVPIHPGTHELLFDPQTGDPLVIPPQQDQGMQEITVSVYFHDELVLTTESYKVNR